MRRAGLVAAALVAVLACGGAWWATGTGAGGGGRSQPLTVKVEIRHSRFLPSTVRVPAGAEVRFVVGNDDPIDHELVVGPPEVHARHRHGTDRGHDGGVPGEVSVPAGARAETTYRFPHRGTYVFACHLPGHLEYGMGGAVVVY